MSLQETIVYTILTLVTARALHHLFLWMDKKGWLFYVTKPSGSAMGNAMQEINSLMHPQIKEIQELKLDEQTNDQDNKQSRPPVDM